MMNRYGKQVLTNCDLAWERLTEACPDLVGNRLARRTFDHGFLCGIEFQLGVEPTMELLEPVES